jgi:MFS family permease
VLLYLALTMAPFAVVAPLIGPWMDRQRGGRRAAVIGSLAARCIVCLFMAEHLDGLLLFPEAFAVLVLGKGYGVARAAIVPSLVRDTSGLVEANAKLTLVSGVVGFVAALPGVLLLQIGATWVLLLAAVVFAAGAVAGLRIPPAEVAPAEEPPDAEAELHRTSILVAASQMAVMRGIVGFLAFLLAFSLRRDGAAPWWFGLVLAAGAIGALGGAGLAPALRRFTREEPILLGSLIGVSLGAVLAIWVGGRPAAVLISLVVGVAASSARLCFDAIVQRDAPDADQGRTFARFETRFQLTWVAGAFIPVVLSLPAIAGYVVVAVAATVASASHVANRLGGDRGARGGGRLRMPDIRALRLPQRSGARNRKGGKEEV